MRRRDTHTPRRPPRCGGSCRIPKRPRPGKVTLDTLKTWNVTNSNDASPLSVLKRLGMLSASGEPMQRYTEFMMLPPAGPRALGARIRDVYKDLFETAHEPHKNSSELKTFFNIHSGGGERAVELQVQTFKALSEYADFGGTLEAAAAGATAEGQNASSAAAARGPDLPPIRIDLHIHLPENKSARDYEAIIQDIAKYIDGRSTDERS